MSLPIKSSGKADNVRLLPTLTFTAGVRISSTPVYNVGCDGGFGASLRCRPYGHYETLILPLLSLVLRR